MTGLEVTVDQKQDAISLLEAELAQTRKRLEDEGRLSEIRIHELEARLEGLEEETRLLRKERSDNLFQLKQMNR